MEETNNPENTPQPEIAPQTPPTEVKSHETSNDTKTIVTVLLLIFVLPVGLIVMWMWPKWPKWVKLLVTLPIVLIFIGLVAVGFLAAVNPKAQVERAKCVRACIDSGGTNCEQKCLPEPR